MEYDRPIALDIISDETTQVSDDASFLLGFGSSFDDESFDESFILSDSGSSYLSLNVSSQKELDKNEKEIYSTLLKLTNVDCLNKFSQLLRKLKLSVSRVRLLCALECKISKYNFEPDIHNQLYFFSKMGQDLLKARGIEFDQDCCPLSGDDEEFLTGILREAKRRSDEIEKKDYFLGKKIVIIR